MEAVATTAYTEWTKSKFAPVTTHKVAVGRDVENRGSGRCSNSGDSGENSTAGGVEGGA